MTHPIKVNPESLRRWSDGNGVGADRLASAVAHYGRGRYLDGLSDAVNLIMAIGGEVAPNVARQLDAIIIERRESLRRQDP